MTRNFFSPGSAAFERTILSLMWVFLGVINLPHMMTVREVSFFLALLLTVFVLQRDGRWQWPPLKYLLLLWTAVVTMSLLASGKPLYSLEMVKKEVIYYIAAFWLFFIMTRNEDDFIFLMYAILASATVYSAVCVYHYFFLGHSYDYMAFTAEKLYGRSTDTSIFMIVSGVLCFTALRLDKVPKALKLWAAALMPFTVLLIYLARHRSGYFIVMLYLLFAVHALASRALKPTGRKKILFHTALTVAILLPALLLIANRELAWAPWQSLSIYAGDERWTIWRQALGMIIERPLLGTGFGNKDFFVPTLRGGWYFYPHNIFLDYGVMAGLPGMLAVMALFGGLGLMFRKNLRRFRDRDAFAYAASMSGALILTGFFIESLRDTAMRLHTGLFFWAVMGMVLGSCRQLKRAPRPARPLPDLTLVAGEAEAETRGHASF